MIAPIRLPGANAKLRSTGSAGDLIHLLERIVSRPPLPMTSIKYWALAEPEIFILRVLYSAVARSSGPSAKLLEAPTFRPTLISAAPFFHSQRSLAPPERICRHDAASIGPPPSRPKMTCAQARGQG